jgi:hypothetical protein
MSKKTADNGNILIERIITHNESDECVVIASGERFESNFFLSCSCDGFDRYFAGALKEAVEHAERHLTIHNPQPADPFEGVAP